MLSVPPLISSITEQLSQKATLLGFSPPFLKVDPTK